MLLTSMVSCNFMHIKSPTEVSKNTLYEESGPRVDQQQEPVWSQLKEGMGDIC